MKQDRQAEIDRQNKLLIKRLENIYKGQGTVDSWNQYKPHRYLLMLYLVFTPELANLLASFLIIFYSCSSVYFTFSIIAMPLL